jgi:hypothetical protein
MNRIYLLIVIGLLSTYTLEAKKIAGKIEFDDETVDVIFKIRVNFFLQKPDFEKLQYKIKYYDSTGKKITLRPDDAQEISFSYAGENVRMLSRYNSIGLGNIFAASRNIFLRLETDGDLKLFNYYYTQTVGGSFGAMGAVAGSISYSVDKYILQKGNGLLKRPKAITFKKDMIEYFRDCPALAERIENKDFRGNDIEAIAKYYNSECR